MWLLEVVSGGVNSFTVWKLQLDFSLCGSFKRYLHITGDLLVWGLFLLAGSQISFVLFGDNELGSERGGVLRRAAQRGSWW